MDLLSPRTLEPLIIISAGIFASLGLVLNVAITPILLASSDPVPIWKMMDQTGKTRLALPSVVLPILGNLACWLSSGDSGFLVLFLLSASQPAYVLIIIRKARGALSAATSRTPLREVHQLVRDWNTVVWGRTVLGFGIFALQVYKMQRD